MDRIRQDLRSGVRALAARPGVTALAIISLALGIGANGAVFSVFHGVVLSPPPYEEPDRLLSVGPMLTEGGRETPSGFWSYPMFQEFAGRTRSFDALAAYWTRSFNLGGDGAAERVDVEMVSADYHRALRVRPALGRVFLLEEDETPGSHAVILLGHGLWQRHFGEARDVIGKTVRLNDTSLEVIGVLPEGFRGLSEKADAWVPMMMAPTLTFRSRLSNANSQWAQVVGRLAHDVTPPAAAAEFASISPGIAAALPADVVPAGAGLGFHAQSLQSARVDQALANPLHILLAVVGFVLLIACANVANLLLSRGISRRPEFALRLAVGARPARVIRQVLTESLLLAGMGAVAGLLVALWSLEILRTVRPAALERALELGTIHLDGTVLGFSLLLSVASGLIFGAIPAIHASRTNVSEALKKAAGRTSGGTFSMRTGSRGLLVAGQIAVALVLLIGAGLMVQSLTRLQSKPLGFRPDNVLTARLSLPRSYSPEQTTLLLEEMARAGANLPGVDSAAVVYCLPVDGGCDMTGLSVEGETLDQPPIVTINMIGGDYLETFSIPLRRGRTFLDTDRAGAPRVAMIGEALATELWPGEDAIGKRVRPGLGWPEGEWAEIVGVTGDVPYAPVEQPMRMALYLPFQQFSYETNYIALRGQGRAADYAGMLRDRLASLDASLPLFDIAVMDQRIASSMSRDRFSAFLLGSFSILGVALALVGVYSVISHAVSGRTREIGIRLSLGATRRDVLGLLLRDGALLTAAGIVMGLVGALAASRWLAAELYGISAVDPATYAALALAMAAVALAACYLPARRALQVDPVTALRDE